MFDSIVRARGQRCGLLYKERLDINDMMSLSLELRDDAGVSVCKSLGTGNLVGSTER